MNDLKKIAWLVMLIAGLAVTSCKNTSNKGFLPDSAEYKQPAERAFGIQRTQKDRLGGA